MDISFECGLEKKYEDMKCDFFLFKSHNFVIYVQII
jgi:hypothetical protein